MNIRYDLHIHTILSPCADKDMTPQNVVQYAKLLGLDVIAITDHNSCANCPAALKVGKEVGITVIPGMELCTSEEIHAICLFPDIERAMSFSKYVDDTIPNIENNPKIFGDQLVMNEHDEVIKHENKLLITGTSISLFDAINLVRDHDGVLFPAHIDRTSFSVVSVLGDIPEEYCFQTLELSRNANKDKLIEDFSTLKMANILVNSDAHRLSDMWESTYTMNVRSNSIQNVLDYIRAKQ